MARPVNSTIAKLNKEAKAEVKAESVNPKTTPKSKATVAPAKEQKPAEVPADKKPEVDKYPMSTILDIKPEKLEIKLTDGSTIRGTMTVFTKDRKKVTLPENVTKPAYDGKATDRFVMNVIDNNLDIVAFLPKYLKKEDIRILLDTLADRIKTEITEPKKAKLKAEKEAQAKAEAEAKAADKKLAKEKADAEKKAAKDAKEVEKLTVETKKAETVEKSVKLKGEKAPAKVAVTTGKTKAKATK